MSKREDASIKNTLREYDEMVTAFRASGIDPEVARKQAMGYIAHGRNWDDCLLQARIDARSEQGK